MSETPEEIERLERVELLLRQYRTQQFSQFEWSEIEMFVNELERTQPSYEELVSRLEEYVANVIHRRERK